uniref:FBD domain-containing protein n=1 Tax=Solanum lycopersicum TaxID=4081 RepID=A0A3Q7G7L1_SOLLC
MKSLFGYILSLSRWILGDVHLSWDIWPKEHDIHFLSSFEFPYLENVKVFSSSKMCLKGNIEWDNDDLLKLSEFILKNATVSEKFIIISKRKTCKICSLKCASRYSLRLVEKLVGCSRSSTSSVIIWQKGAFRD